VRQNHAAHSGTIQPDHIRTRRGIPALAATRSQS
jgi:hypothetical protein